MCSHEYGWQKSETGENAIGRSATLESGPTLNDTDRPIDQD